MIITKASYKRRTQKSGEVFMEYQTYVLLCLVNFNTSENSNI
jgi:hypothetical protein